MKKISISALVLAFAIAISASATVTTPPATTTATTTTAATTTSTTTVRATSTKHRTDTKVNNYYYNNNENNNNRNNNNNNKDKDSLSKKELKRADASCAITALTKRDSLVTAALQKYTSSWIDSINTRRTAQSAAFSKEGNERIQLLKSSRVIAKKTQDTIQKELRRTKMAAGEVFRGEMRICGYSTDSSDE